MPNSLTRTLSAPISFSSFASRVARFNCFRVLGTVAWLVLGAAALFYQMRDVGQTITSVDRSAYRY